jgi:hypothetical protein
MKTFKTKWQRLSKNESRKVAEAVAEVAAEVAEAEAQVGKLLIFLLMKMENPPTSNLMEPKSFTVNLGQHLKMGNIPT